MGGASRIGKAAGVAAIVLLAACTGEGADRADPSVISDVAPGSADRTAPASTDVMVAPAPSDTPTTTEAPAIDIASLLRSDPLIGLNVTPPMPDGADLPLPRGMADFDDQFTTEGAARWATAREHLGIYKLHAWQVRHFLSDDQLRTVFAFLDEHDLALMFETEPLPPPDPSECDHVESFEGPYDLEMARRIRDLGGTIHIVAIEEPYHFAHKLEGPGACRYPVERVVDEVIDYVSQMRQIFPGVPVGTIEPIWSSPPTTPDDMAIWLDTYAERAGEPFAFLHLDPDWARSDWAEVAAGIEDVADARGVPLGVLYNGGNATDSTSWMQALAEHAVVLEDDHGVTPQHIMFQSWFEYPELALPDDEPSSLTSSIVRYTADRSTLAAELVDGRTLVATLRTENGTPIVGASIDVESKILGDSVGEAVLRGVVPEGATDAEILVRINSEGAGPGPADVRLERIGYVDGGAETSIVPNGDFDDGLAGWGFGGDPRGDLIVGGDGVDRWLELKASPDEQIVLNGPVVPVVSGSAYELSVRYGIDPATVGSTVVAVEFLGLARHQLVLGVPVAPLLSSVTGADGTAEFDLDEFPRGPYEMNVTTPGALDHWPAWTTIAGDR